MKEMSKEVKMVDACEIITCGVASTPKYVDKDIGVVFLSAQNVRKGEVVLDKFKYISKEFHAHLTKKNKPKKGDILYSRVGAKYGEAAVVEHDFEFSVYVSLTLIRPKKELFNNYYFKYYLNSPKIKDLARKSISSSGVPNLNVKSVREFPISISPLQEQRQIVEILDEAFSAIDQAKANIEKNIVNAKELFQSKLNAIFSQKGDGWEAWKLDNICLKITQGPNPKLGNDIPSENNYILKTKDFYNDRVLYDKCNKVSASLLVEWSRFMLKDDDIIIGLVGVGSIGKSNIFKEQEGRKYIFTRATGLIRTKKDILIPNYLRFYLLSGLGIESIDKGIGGTTGQLVIKTSYFKNLKIIIPQNLKEQEEIIHQANIIQSQTDEIIKIYTNKLKSLKELKKSILQKAFSGALIQKEVEV